ncbi:TPA: tetratricopeptide repeat protein [Candidatus Gastranaerophilales bacterium HUM_20]|nr:tPR repeat protein [Clostridium sp. CAG:729]DAB18928.1 MAG TPA: tetratricopeptide repeat protein [Candidatus Gastranaerophilales bacterium HUM_20]
MKKAFLLASILFISVISTACINNFAVQELNNKAKDFMDKGDYVSAIERLKSSIDLDGTVFETQYNLAVAYTKAEDYSNAIKTYNDAIKLNPNFPDAYYSLAVCEENLAKDIIAGEVKVNDDDSFTKAEESDEEDISDKKELSENDKKMLTTLLNNAISDYMIYQDKNPTSDDKTYVENKVKELQMLLAEYTVK